MQKLNMDTPKKSIRNIIVGEKVKIYDFVNLYDCTIGSGSKIGTFVEIQKAATIGKNCKISSHSFICEGVHIGDGVFVGHHVAFINDKYPRAVNPDGSLQTKKDWEVQKTIVHDRAAIGTGAIILCGISIGENALVGAGSVVTKDVPPNVIVAGNPARFIRKIDA